MPQPRTSIIVHVTDTDRPTLAAWLAPEHADFVRAVAEHAGLRVIAAGSPVKGRAGEVARAFDATPIDDLRAAMTTFAHHGEVLASAASDSERRPDIFWVAALDDTSVTGDHSVLGAMRQCMQAGMSVVTSEPLPASVLEYAAPSDQPGVAGVNDDGVAAEPVDLSRARLDWPQFIPLIRSSRGWIEAAEQLPEFGPIRTMQVESFGLAVECSLGARLLDAMDLVRSVLGEPEDIYATHVVPPGISYGYSPGAPESLRGREGGASAGLHGTVSASMRFSDGRAASVLVSDVAGRWARSVTLLGDPNADKGGRLRIVDNSLEWSSPRGAILEAPRPKKRTGAAVRSTISPAVEVFADLLSEAGQRRLETLVPMNHLGVLAMTGAALLSARTGEPESPQMIRRMVTGG